MQETTQTSVRKKRICVITTYATALDLFNRGMFETLRDNGWDIVGICGPEPVESIQNIRNRGFKVVPMPIVRPPAPFRDLWCLLRLWWFFLWNRFDIIHSSTPKAMLLGTLAAFLSGHRNRVITFRGRAYENSTGLKRKLFIGLDKLTCRLSKKVVCISPSLRDVMLEDGIGDPQKLIVFGTGSSNGVDTNEYSRDNVSAEEIKNFRAEQGLQETDNVILCIGRIRQDKGINELVRAFLSLAGKYHDWHLSLVGRDEPVGVIFPDVQSAMADHPQIHRTEWMSKPQIAYAAADILAFPTWREGFGNASTEANAMELPVVTTDAVGARDSIADGETGLIVPMQQVEPLAEALEKLMTDSGMRLQFGKAGRERAIRDFRPGDIWNAMLDVFNQAL